MEKPKLLNECLSNITNDCEEEGQVREIAEGLLNRLKEDDGLVCRLNKAIYGLRQAGRQWHKRLSQKLKEIGFKSTDSSWITEIKRLLAREFDVKDLGKAKYCLGIEIEQSSGMITMTQRRYIMDLLERFGMTNCNSVATPMDKDNNLIKELNCDSNKRPYRELVGALMYLAVATRPDISHTVSILAQFNDCHGEAHWAAGKRVLRYLKGTLNYGISYRKTDDCAKIYVNADWGRCKIDRRSYTGYVVMLSNGPISWKSTKQRADAGVCQIENCGKRIKAGGGSTSGLHAHLRTIHKINLLKSKIVNSNNEIENVQFTEETSCNSRKKI
ncbi:hypothetical protein KPH14_012675, partial [Odynerus spinipes]